jgi:hypothetical protein
LWIAERRMARVGAGEGMEEIFMFDSSIEMIVFQH